jgi:hypothetical protein
MADEQQHDEDHIPLGDEAYPGNLNDDAVLDGNDDVDYAAEYVDGEGEYDDAALDAAFEDDQVRGSAADRPLLTLAEDPCLL